MKPVIEMIPLKKTRWLVLGVSAQGGRTLGGGGQKIKVTKADLSCVRAQMPLRGIEQPFKKQ